ncbi:MAG: hypothetical protein PHS92_04185 [Candidatus Gracilibacteria bacterium]|nr:hypothetical protein [Candidatus Gracilibacteria bacterium]
MMNKIKLLLLLSAMSISFNAYAINPAVSSTFENSCPGDNTNERYYLPTGSNTRNIYPLDMMRTPGLSFISNGDSQVKVWSRESGSLSPNCSSALGWTPPLGGRVSSVSPGGMRWIIAFANNDCVISKPSVPNPSAPVAQFVYNIGYKTEIGKSSGNTPTGYFYREPVGGGAGPTVFIPDQTNRIWSSVITHPNECWNVYLSYCGDTVIDSAEGEVCDFNDTTHAGWGTAGCNASCQPISNPPPPPPGGSCIIGNLSSTTSGLSNGTITTTNYTNATNAPLLCAGGSVPSVLTITGNSATWSCDGYAGCLTSWSSPPPPPGGSCIIGNLSSTTLGLLNGTITTTNYTNTTNAPLLCAGGSVPSVLTITGNSATWSCDGYAGCLTSWSSPPLFSCVIGNESVANLNLSNGMITTTNYTNATYSALLCAGGSIPSELVLTEFSATWKCNGYAGCLTSWTTTIPGTITYCGDGFVEIPNSDGINETCDQGSNNGQPGYSCDIDCKELTTAPAGTSGNALFKIKTNPGVGYPVDISIHKTIIGNGVRLFMDTDKLYFDGNGGNYYLGGKTAIVKDNSSLITGPATGEVSKPLDSSYYVGDIWFLKPDGTYEVRHKDPSIEIFDGHDLSEFKGNPISSIYEQTSTHYPPSSSANTFFASISYLEEAMPIRVAKSAISNISGGSAFVFKPAGYNLDIINTGEFIANLKKGNFVVSSINSQTNIADINQRLGGLYYTDDSNVVNSSYSDYVSEKQEFSNITKNLLPHYPYNIGSQIDLNVFLANTSFNFGKNNNVKLIGNNSDLAINGDLSLSGKRTIILEKGDLIINNNISYSDKDASWAFIVKEGDIRISNDVKKISGVFMTLSGSIVSNENTNTTNQLVVDGGLYGDSGNLVDNRAYIRATEGYHSISTGVMINYSLRALKNPPPLLSNFIKQFNLFRVAK